MKTIFHIDVNSAFLSWSAVKRLKEDPNALDLRTVPSVVGGDRKTRHGIVTAKSIPAKKFGIKTADTVASAIQRCPDLIVIPADFTTYREYSRAFIKILKSYTDKVEQVSIDEAYLDATNLGDPIELAERIKAEIRDTLGFTVNVGISSNKLLAKMASDFSKPDKIHTLFIEEVPDKMWPLPIGELHGCGKKTSEKLQRFGISTIGDAASTSLEVLQSILGEKGGEYIFNGSRGNSSDKVHTEHEEAKSYSNETTLPHDITPDNYEAEMAQVLKWLSEKVSARLKKDGVFAKTIDVQVKTNTFHRRSIQTKLPDATNEADTIFKTAAGLIDKLLLGENGVFRTETGIRLVGVGATDLDNGEYRQLDLFSYQKEQEEAKLEKKAQKEKEDKLNAMADIIKGKFGEGAISRGFSR